MHISYDYSELIEELEGDIVEGLINQEGSLLIVRSTDAVDMEEGLYYPIVDYYTEDFEQSITEEIKDLKREIEVGASRYEEGLDEELKQDRKLLRLFKKDKDRLEKKSVNEVLVEMYDRNRITR